MSKLQLKEKLKHLKKESKQSKVTEVEVEIREKEKLVRECESKAAEIDAAVFDLKAVNPNVVAKVDTRTPQQIIESIEVQGKIVANALSNLKTLLAQEK